MPEDHFAELGVERRLSLGAEELRARYDARCREAHPDAGGEADAFQRLRGAYALLSSPAQRLRHWLELGGKELEAGGGPGEGVTALFGELGPLLQRAREVARRHAGAKSALARSLAEREGMGALAELEGARERIRELMEGLTERFTRFDAEGVGSCAEEAAATARSLLFLERWEAELRVAWSNLGCW